jgi:O-antigen/teichoic acid export membrane protein
VSSLSAASRADRRSLAQDAGSAGRSPSGGDTATAAAAARTLRSLVVSGFAWSLATTVLVQISSVVFAVLLARFLTPREYGIAAMALVFSALVFAFADLSLGVGLVQRAEITEEDRSTVFWTSVAVGIALTAGGIAASGPLASFFGEPDVQPLFAVLSLSFVVGSLGATHAALLHRAMDFRSISIRVGSSTLVGGTVGVGLAAAGFGAWALIVQQLCVAVIATTLLWVSMPWRPRLVYSMRSLRELGSFGGRIFGVRVADYARLNGDKLLIGRVLGPASLGTYSVAFNILLTPVSRFLLAVTDTLFPALARLQDDPARMASVWLRVNRVVSAAFVPALLGLAVVASDFVSVVLGPQWAEVAPLLQIMALGVVAHAVSLAGAEVLKALGRGGPLLRFYVAETVAFMAAILVGLRWGVTGVAAAFALVSIPTRAYFVRLTGSAIGVSFRRFLASLTGVGEASVALVAATLSTRMLLLETAAPAWLRLLVVIAIGVAVYVPVCLWRVPDMRVELRRVVGERRTGRAVAATSAAD